ncbi:MAG: tRNA pseudouridine synthase A [Planctomycetes bacterium]|nr:tRNA pseudouridine synthase A [Planctomycetota bacterium]
MPRFALFIAYDGTAFAGWWRQKDRRTVAGEIDRAFARLGERGAEAVGASRTDAGVHAKGQVAHVDLKRAWQPLALANALARQLPADVSCYGVAAVADDWHAVHLVRSKNYRYVLDVGDCPDPFIAARFSWRVAKRPTLADLRSAAALVPGSRDWRAFRRRGDHRDDTRCRVLRCTWTARERYLICSISATGFIYRLARSLVGGMLGVATGALEWGDWRAALDGETTEASRQQAPALGLCLHHINYPSEPEWVEPGSS